MGKNGPCYHCGVISTPLWRNGPPEKPVLCNACGSRWRTKGTLTNYTPLHSRPELIDFEVHRVPKVKIISPKKNKEVKLLKRKKNHDNVMVGGMFFDDNCAYKKVKNEDTSNRSSSGSAISNPESCTQFGGTNASPVQSVVWETMPASKRSTFMGRSKASSIDKLTKDLYTILHEQQSLHLSGSSEEELLFESKAPMVSVEIGHGGVLIRHPSSIARDEESETSSISIDNKNFLTKSVAFATMPVHNENKGVNFLLEQKKREKSQQERFQVLASSNSPMCDINLHDVVNFDEFMTHFTNEEHQELVKYLPFVDTSEFPNSLKSMYDSDQFKESVHFFQKLLAEGVFDGSLVGVKPSDCKTLKRLALHNLRKGQWVEQYNLLKKCKNSTEASAVGGSNVSKSSQSVNIKRLPDDRNKIIPEVDIKVMVPKNTKANYVSKESIYIDSSCFSPRSLFRLPSEHSSFMFDSYHFASETSDEDILLDVPSNNSFPQAELIRR